MYKQIRRRLVKGEKDPQNNKCHKIPYETRAGHHGFTTLELVTVWIDLLNLIGKSFVKITLQNSRPISKKIETFIAIWWGCLNKTFERRPPLCQHNSCTDIKPRTRSCHSARSASNMFSDRLRRLLSRYSFRLIEGFKK